VAWRSQVGRVKLVYVNLFGNNQCHKYKIAVTGVFNAMIFTIWAKGGIARLHSNFFAIIIIKAGSFNYMIGFVIADMLVITK